MKPEPRFPIVVFSGWLPLPFEIQEIIIKINRKDTFKQKIKRLEKILEMKCPGWGSCVIGGLGVRKDKFYGTKNFRT
jgi:hypothetical protein